MPPEGTKARDLFEDPVIVGVTFESGAFTSNLFGDRTTNEFRGADFLRPADPRYYIEYPKFQPFVGTVRVGDALLTRGSDESLTITSSGQSQPSRITAGSEETHTIHPSDYNLTTSWDNFGPETELSASISSVANNVVTLSEDVSGTVKQGGLLKISGSATDTKNLDGEYKVASINDDGTEVTISTAGTDTGIDDMATPPPTAVVAFRAVSITGFLEIVFLEGRGRYKKSSDPDRLSIDASSGSDIIDVSNMDVQDLDVTTAGISLRVNSGQLSKFDISNLNDNVIHISDDVKERQTSHIPDFANVNMSTYHIIARDVILGTNYSTSAQEIRIPVGDWNPDIHKVYDITTVMSEPAGDGVFLGLLRRQGIENIAAALTAQGISTVEDLAEVDPEDKDKFEGLMNSLGLNAPQQAALVTSAMRARALREGAGEGTTEENDEVPRVASYTSSQIPNLMPRARARWSGTGNFFTVLEMFGPITSVEPVWILSKPYIEKDYNDTFVVTNGLIKPVGSHNGGYVIDHQGQAYIYGSTLTGISNQKTRSRNPRKITAIDQADGAQGYIIPSGQIMPARSDSVDGRIVTGDGTLFLLDSASGMDMTKFDVKHIKFLRPFEDSQIPRRLLPSDHTNLTVQLEPTFMEDYVQISFDNENDVMTILGGMSKIPKLTNSAKYKIKIRYYDEVDYDLVWAGNGLSFRRQNGAFSDEELARSIYTDAGGSMSQFVWFFSESPIAEVLNLNTVLELKTYRQIVGKGIVRISYNANLSDILPIVKTDTLEIASGYQLTVLETDLEDPENLPKNITGQGTVIMQTTITEDLARIVASNFTVSNLRITATTSVNYLPFRYASQNRELVEYPGQILYTEDSNTTYTASSLDIMYLDDFAPENEIATENKISAVNSITGIHASNGLDAGVNLRRWLALGHEIKNYLDSFEELTSSSLDASDARSNVEVWLNANAISTQNDLNLVRYIVGEDNLKMDDAETRLLEWLDDPANEITNQLDFAKTITEDPNLTLATATSKLRVFLRGEEIVVPYGSRLILEERPKPRSTSYRKEERLGPSDTNWLPTGPGVHNTLYFASENIGDDFSTRLGLYYYDRDQGYKVLEPLSDSALALTTIYVSRVGSWIKTTNVPTMDDYQPIFESGRIYSNTTYRVVTQFGEIPTPNSAEYIKDKRGTWYRYKDYKNDEIPTSQVWFTDSRILDFGDDLRKLNNVVIRGVRMNTDSELIFVQDENKLLASVSEFLHEPDPAVEYLFANNTGFVCFARIIGTGVQYVFKVTYPQNLQPTADQLKDVRVFSAGHALEESLTLGDLRRQHLPNFQIPIHFDSDTDSPEDKNSIWIPGVDAIPRNAAIRVSAGDDPYFITSLPLPSDITLVGDGRVRIQTDITEIDDIDDIHTELTLVMDGNDLIVMSSNKLSHRTIEFSTTKTQTLRVIGNSYIDSSTSFVGVILLSRS